MPSLERSESTRTYWRSLNELQQTPEFEELLANEFPAGPDQQWTESSRRRFLQIMGASLALGSASACRWQKEAIAPMVDRPEGWVPGKPRHYASMMQVGGVAEGLVVTSYDGRPTKVEGNGQHPASVGATSTHAQAATLELCDPDRSRGPVRFVDGAEVEATLEDFAGFTEAMRARASSGQGLAVVAPANSSPAFASLRERFADTFPQARFVVWEAWSRIEEQRGLQALFGTPARPVYDLEQADVVLSLDEDLLGLHPDRIRHSKAFGARRRPEERTMNRLYAVEPNFTLTGANADHRLPVRGAQVAAVLAAVQAELASAHGVGQAPANAPGGGILGEEKTRKFVQVLAADLAAAGSRALVAVGPTQPAAVHAAAHALNVALGARGTTVEYHDCTEAPASDPAELVALAEAMQGGEVDTIVFLGTNPVYDAPADLAFGEALGKVAHKVHCGLYRDETAVACDWHVNAAHWLESWGDARAWDGTHTLAQPLIAPLYDGVDAYAFLGMLIGRGQVDAQSWIRQEFTRAYGPDELTWRKAVQRGFHPGTSLVRAEGPAGNAPALAVDAGTLAAWQEGQPLEVNFRADATLYDGRYANLGWLQELPDPMTKLTWDNAAVIGPSTAEALGVKDHDLVTVELDGRSLEMAVYVLPGQAAGTVALPLGYGRTESGHVAGLVGDEVQPVGFNTYALRSSAALGNAAGATVTKAGGTYKLASTQDHHAIDNIGMAGIEGRLDELVREGTLDEWKEHPDFAQHAVHHPPLKSLWKEHDYEGHRWGMAIDLSACTGCSACTIACQAENNIPVVGKEQVMKGREMAWIRMDRYFSGDKDNPQIQQQPVACQQCENAPCEQVCPVAATVHSSEGLNDMVYNRCIGTRYCSNNCPYKVRRFNYLNWNKDLKEEGAEVRRLSMNPDVTVRVRGVMEKCTYCVQRIATARVNASTDGRTIQDGDVVTACQQVCPADAIHFGDLNDEQSKVRRSHDGDRAYAMLAELNNKPRTAFLAAIRNPHPELAPAHAADGHGHGEEDEHHG